MQWFPEQSQRVSDKNGLIVLEKSEGYPRVLVDGYSETSEGLNEIWWDAMLRAKAKLNVKVTPCHKLTILILGLGGGGMVYGVHTLFPHCRIVAVEHDPAMVALAKELKLYEPFPLPEIVEQDAGEYLSGATEKYHLTAVDLFRGGEPSPLLLDTHFLAALQEKMLPGGVLLLNVAGTQEYLTPAVEHFAHGEIWKFRYNHLGMFWN